MNITSLTVLSKDTVAKFIENDMLVSLMSSLSGETRNSVGMARLAEPDNLASGLA